MCSGSLKKYIQSDIKSVKRYKVILKNTWSEDNLAWKIKTYFILVINSR